jgi:selT/selW/selH-like putative selenoprotein
MENQVIIEYCLPCGYEQTAMQLAQEIKNQFGSKIGSVETKPDKLIGSFDVYFRDELIYSKKKTMRLPDPGEVEQIILMKLVK